jgi:hypothetical protein
MGEIAVVRDKVQTYLRELVGRFEVDEDGDYSFRDGSARLFVSVSELGERAVVDIWSILALDVPESPELYEFVATTSYRFGSLLARKQDDGKLRVLLTHSLLGDFLDPDELKMAAVMIGTTADDVDDEVRSRFGGVRFHED